ncbi:hypothetical protein [Flindersiella endophytica]
MDFPPDGLAPPDTDLGLLQRGRGAGWLRARAAGSRAGADLLLACVAHDPRWDRQVEPRGDYYAQLALHLSVPPAALPVAADPDDDWLRLQVLQGMASRGSAAAARLLADAGGVDDGEASEAPSRQQNFITADAPVEVLLGTAASLMSSHRKAILQRLRTTSDESEIAALRRASLEVDSPGWRLAIQVLAQCDDPTAIPVAAAVLEADQPGGKRAWAFRYIRTLSAGRSLPLARAWLSLPDARGAVAACVLPAFGATWATECLWDCEESVRARAAEFAPLTPDVTTRLTELAEDVHEYPIVCEAAGRRRQRTQGREATM